MITRSPERASLRPLTGFKPVFHCRVSHLANDILPNYEVLDLLGRGGMGVVYKARQTSLDRLVAIKLLPRDLIRDDIDFTERFKQEARTMAKLSHPGIVPVFDFGEAGDGQLFFVMEFIDGTDLAKLIEQRGALSIEEALRVFHRVAEALVYAHGEGVVHRDIKPANVLLKANGEVKVVDFGLAKIVTPGTAALTDTATSMGSHDFAAPEIFVHGGDADHRADVYSLGVMLYQMLTGTIPRGMFKMPSERVPELDERFDEVICRALEQDRKDRFQSVREMIEAMPRESGQPASTNETKAGMAVPTPARRVLLGLAASLVVGGGAMLWHQYDVAAQAKTLAHSPLSTEWQDVLSEVDLAAHQWSGNWQKVPNGLESTDPVRGGALELPISAPGASDLRIKLTRLTSSLNKATVLFRLGAHGGQFSIDDYKRPYAGLELIDGQQIAESGERVGHVLPYLRLGHTHELLLQLREEGMAAVLDGVEIYRWKGDWSRVQPGGWKMLDVLKDRKIFACAATTGRLRIEAVAFRDVVGVAGKTLPPPPAGGLRSPPLPEAQVFPGNGHRYQYVPGWFTWSQADANARSMGGHLLTISSQEENDWVWRTFSSWVPFHPQLAGWWTGGLKNPPTAPWAWVTGEPFEFNRHVEGDDDKNVPLPRLIQSNNGGENMPSSWHMKHYTSLIGYVVEWDE